MLYKLAKRNARRSLKDYSIYILTVVLSFSLIYAFNMILYSEDIKMLSKMLKNMDYVVISVSVVVVFVIGGLVHYMCRFMFQKRSKELGTYMVLGISNRAISKMFLMENIILGFAGLAGGILFGSLLYQVFTLVIMNVFKVPYEIHMVFSAGALLWTLVYGFFIYAFSLLRMKRRLKKMKVYDLLYAEKKNETAMVKRSRSHWVLITFAAVFIIFGGMLMRFTFHNSDQVSMGYVFVSVVCFILGIYCFYISLSSLLVRLFLKNKKRKYSKDHMFLFRSLSAKMNTMSVTMGTLALLFTLTLSAAELGTFFRNFFESQGVPDFEVSVYLDAKYNDFEPYHNYLEENYGISQEKIYKTYESPGTVYGELQDTPFAGTYMDFDPVMRYSDYAQLREMLGYEPVKLDKGKYIVQGMPGVRDYLEGRPVKKEFEKITLDYGGTYTEKLGVTEGLNGAYYFLVVPDEVAQTLTPYRSIYVADTKKATVESTYLDICGFADPTMDGVAFGNVYVRGTVLAENRSLFTIMVFALFYLGLIFICVAATILAVQQLSDASKFRYRYKILSNLGMQHKRVERLILKQLVIYFAFPLLLPLPISIFITACINQILSAYVNASVMIQSILAALGMFGIVYILYFGATYVGYRKFGTEDF